MLKKTGTCRKLITAIVACFAKKDFSATSIREISTQAGISQGVMYTYFKSKDGLVKAIVLEEQNSALIAHDATYTNSCSDHLCAQVTSRISEIGYPTTHQLQVEIMAKSAHNPELRKTYIFSDDIVRKSFARLIQEGIAAGEFRRNISLEEITIIIFALIDDLIARQAINTTFSFRDDLPTFPDVMAKLLE